MAIALPVPLVGQLTASAVQLPTPTTGQITASAVQLPTPTTGQITQYGVRLPRPNTGEALPSSTTYTVGGGMQLTGIAPRSFLLNGVPVSDPTAYTITPSGGMQLTGAASVTFKLTQRYQYIGTGQMRLTSTAPVSVNWVRYTMQGGMQFTGAATVSAVFPSALNVIAASLPVVGASISGSIGIHAFVDATLPVVQASLSGIAGTIGGIDAQLPIPTASLLGGSNNIEAALPVPAALISGISGVAGGIDAILPRPSAELVGVVAATGQIAAPVPVPTASLNAYAGVVGVVSAGLPAVRAELDALVGVTGQINVRLPRITAELSAFTQITGSIDAVLPVVNTLIFGDLTEQQVMTLVLNTINTALTEYQSYPFESFCFFNGEYLAAGPDGLYTIDSGDTDDGEHIDALVSTGDLDFKSEFLKRITDFYIGMRADGDLTLRISTDEDDPVEYTLGTYDVDTLKQRRVITAKGARGKYWRFELENIDGCDFEYDSMNITVVPVSRRI